MSNWAGKARYAARIRSALGMRARKTARQRASSLKLGFEPLEPRLTLAAAGLVPVGTQPAGALTGKIVYLSPGHGYQYDIAGRWYYGRSESLEIIEPLGTVDQQTYLADYLFRAGATIVPMRPIGHQLNEVVLDNDSPGVTFTGAWQGSGGSRYYDEDYGAVADGATNHYQFASISPTETATATYTPNIPAAGFYPVYAWAAHGTNRTNQLYKVNHSGGTTEVRVDHRMVGNGWVYLGTYHFDAGSDAAGGSVVISNQSTAGGNVVIADAIRFGNGMGDVPDGPSGAGVAGGTISGKPREDEAALMWIIRSIGMGVNTSTFFSVTGTDPNVSGPARMAEEMNPDTNPFGSSVYLAIHSNAAGGRGAIGLITNFGTPTPNQTNFATWVGQQVNEDLRAVDQDLGFTWSTRTTYTLTGQYGEINNDDFINANGVVEMDATLAEVAFHDQADDALIMRDPKGRDAIGRALYQALVQYFDVYGNLNAPLNAPATPTNVSAVSNGSGQATISWSPGPSNAAYGSPASDYRIYASSDGFGFDGGRLASSIPGGTPTSKTITGLDPSIAYYFKVVAVNSGGESPATEVVSALPAGGAKQVLIVNGFDRNDLDLNFKYTTKEILPNGANVTVDRVFPRYNNSFDYVVQVQTAVQAAKPGVHVASTSNEAVISGAVNLNDYDSVIWILGAESTVNHTFDATEQAKVISFLNGGGNLFLSGAEIGWDLDQQNNGRTFYENNLKADYVADDAGAYSVVGSAGSIFAGMSGFSFSNGSTFNNLDGQYFNVATPDVIAPQAGAISALTYIGGTGGSAAIQYGPGGLNSGSIVMFAFPFEGMTSADHRTFVMGRILDFFGVAAPAPGISLEARVEGQDADSPPGPSLTIGSTAAFTYVLTNTGNVAVSAINVTDDNGTPGNAADDFSPAYASGDSNSNGQLDVGETWTYSAMRTVVTGQYSGMGSVAATGNAQGIVANDTLNYFGDVPQNADFNGDDSVDAADYVMWRNNDGLTSGATQSQGDANQDGAVDTTDYNIWTAQFGTTPSPAAAAGSATIESTSSALNQALSPVANLAPGAVPVRNAAFASFSDERNEITKRRDKQFLASPKASFVSSSWQPLLNAVARDIAQRGAEIFRSRQAAAPPEESSEHVHCDNDSFEAALGQIFGRMG